MSFHYRALGLLALIVVALQLGGCGFKLRGDATLRGDVALSKDIRTVHVNAPAALHDELRIFLEGGGVDLAANRAGADASINVTRENFDRRVLSVDPSTGKEREFELAYTMAFNVIRADGTPVISNETVNLLRNYVFDPGSVIGKSREEDVLRNEMRRDAAQQLLRRLQTTLQN